MLQIHYYCNDVLGTLSTFTTVIADNRNLGPDACSYSFYDHVVTSRIGCLNTQRNLKIFRIQP